MDYGHKRTDEELKKLEKRISREYAQAAEETQKKLDDYLARFAIKDQIKREALAKGEITQQEYNYWRTGQIMIGKRWEEMKNTLAEDMQKANEKTASMTRQFSYDAYALNHNYGTFEVEKGSLIDTSYTLYDRHTVERLIRDDPQLLPPPGKKTSKEIAEGRAKLWNKQQIQSVMTQSILQGEPIPKIAERLAEAVSDSNRAAAIRNARTMTTGAENGGRVDSYKRAESMGIKMQQEWIATLDGRTRHEHRQLDGMRVNVGEPFEVDGYTIRFPGDPTADPEMVYNCRCTLIGVVKDTNLEKQTDAGKLERKSKLGDMTYEEWKNEHSVTPADVTPPASESLRQVVNGTDISSTWGRRPDEFDFAIEDVINAQGFDGLPRVVSRAEFDEAVKAANNGEGFIAQRTYSAPDQETLDMYRDQLYNGKWYVDCSTGGAQYGQGMYCAADYTGTLTDGIKAEMDHYKSLYLVDLRDESIPIDERIQMAKSGLASNGFNDATSAKWAEAYVRKDKDAARELMQIIDDDKRQEINDILRTGIEKPSYTETITLDPSAKIITYDELVERASQADAWDIMSNGKTTDLGVFAAQLGYDAINAEGHGQSGSYTVILNRTKVIILGE